MADTHILISTLDLACTNTHTFWGAPLFSTSRRVPLHIQTIWWLSLSPGDLVDDDRHVHPYTPRLIACTNTPFSFTLIGAFSLHACSVTRNSRIYFTSVRLVSLVETVVFQTVLWDIRAWSACFLVHKWFLINFILRKNNSGT